MNLRYATLLEIIDYEIRKNRKLRAFFWRVSWRAKPWKRRRRRA